MAICSACHGFGTWEFWGRQERCPVCEGRGEVDEEPRVEYYCQDCGLTFEPEEPVYVDEARCPRCGSTNIVV